MSKTKKDAVNIFSMPVNEMPSLREECEKYGIEYFEPSFFPVLRVNINETVTPDGWYYLSSDLMKRPDLQKAVIKYNDSLIKKSIIRDIIYFRKLARLEKKYSVKSYSKKEMDECIENYKKEKENEVKKAKAVVKVAKEELKEELGLEK